MTGSSADLNVSSPLRPLLWSWSVLILMGALFGLSFSLARIATTGGAHPLGVAFWQFLIGGLLLGGVLASRGIALRMSGGLPVLYVITGLVGLLLPSTAFFYSAAHVPAGILSLTIAVVPITTFAFSAFAGIERMEFRRGIGVAFGLLAMLILVIPQGSLPEPGQLPWVLLSLASTLCYTALNLILATRAPANANQMMLTTGMFSAAVLFMVPLLVATGSFVSIGWPPTPIEWSLIGLGFLSGTAWTLYFMLVERAGPVFTSFTGNVVTLFGILWGILIFAERNSLWVWLSFATVMIALALVAPRSRAQS